jgi:glycosyltransferase involved in cell wall biosynthesis
MRASLITEVPRNPAITTSFNGAAGIITDGNDGYVIKHPPDANDLSDKMNFLMDSKQLEAMSKEALSTGQKYSAEKNHSNMIKALVEAAGRRKQIKTGGGTDKR